MLISKDCTIWPTTSLIIPPQFIPEKDYGFIAYDNSYVYVVKKCHVLETIGENGKTDFIVADKSFYDFVYDSDEKIKRDLIYYKKYPDFSNHIYSASSVYDDFNLAIIERNRLNSDFINKSDEFCRRKISMDWNLSIVTYEDRAKKEWIKRLNEEVEIKQIECCIYDGNVIINKNEDENIEYPKCINGEHSFSDWYKRVYEDHKTCKFIWQYKQYELQERYCHKCGTIERIITDEKILNNPRYEDKGYCRRISRTKSFGGKE